ncbi:MAG: tetratricopeptide repeat protein, partial [Verrucomicrobiales bacterium]
VHPISLREAVGELRIHPAELTEEEILLFIPEAAKIDQANDPRLTTFARLFAEMASVHNAATFSMEQNDWDFMGVYYDSIDHFGHAFMEYHPPRMEHVSEADFEIYQHVIAACYRFHDLILGRLMHLAGEDTTIILCSDHGYHSDHLRPKETPREPAGPAIWHRDYGVIAMAGPGIRRGEQICGASLLDITPTVLNLLGLPAAEDMDGKSLLHAIDGGRWWTPPPPIKSWEDIAGDAGMHPKDKQEDPFATREALRQLIELGYIEEPNKNGEQAAKDAASEAKFNVARAYLDGGLLDKASKLLEELYQEISDHTRFGIALARVYMRQQRFGEVRALAEKLLSILERSNIDRAERIEATVRKIEEAPEEIIARAKEQWEKTHQQRVDAERANAEEALREPEGIERAPSPVDGEYLSRRKDMLREESERLRGYDVRSAPTVHLLLGRLEAIEGNFDKALELLGEAERTEPRLPGLHLQLGQTYLRMRRSEEAARAFEKALDIDPDNALAHEGLATALARLRRYEEAIDHGLSAVELIHDLPGAHLRLGATLARLGLFEKAVLAFETCLKLAPRTPAAHRFLAMIYRTRLGRTDLASFHSISLRQILERNKREASPADEQQAARTQPPAPSAPTGISATPSDTWGTIADPSEVITIVTGLPRSGTSMMMQMLVAGGMAPLTDGIRGADTSNPKGYIEFEKATRLSSDSSWLGEAKGRVVKIVAQLLPYLPAEVDGKPANYRIVFMDRDLEEVVASQRTMLDHQRRRGAQLGGDQLAEIFGSQLGSVTTFIEDHKIPCITICYSDAINTPHAVASDICHFLDRSLDTAAMSAAVDPALHRERASAERTRGSLRE